MRKSQDVARVLLVGAALTCAIALATEPAAAQEPEPYVGPASTIPTTAPEPQTPVEPEVQGTTDSSEAEETRSANQVAGSALAFTGNDMLMIVLVGGTLLIGGLGVLSIRRRTSVES